MIYSIRKLARSHRLRASQVVTGIGDDCAVLRLPGRHEVLVTTDFSLEGVHFRREWHPADSVGHRCLARGLSDIAAMGGDPVAAFLSLALPPDLTRQWADRFLKGLLRLARQFGIPLAGGDVAQSTRLVVADIVVVGSAPRGRAIRRSGARAGDLLYVTGALGRSAAVLDRLRAGARPQPRRQAPHFFPQPRIEVGRYLREHRLASAMIDVSDGLSTDLNHICEESGGAAVLWRDAIPAPAGLEFALNGGEDYELLFTARPTTKLAERIAGVPIRRIGEIIGGKGEVWIQNREAHWIRVQPGGWEHFLGSGEHRGRGGSLHSKVLDC